MRGMGIGDMGCDEVDKSKFISQKFSDSTEYILEFLSRFTTSSPVNTIARMSAILVALMLGVENSWFIHGCYLWDHDALSDIRAGVTT